MSQISMFDLEASERYKIRKPIRLIELFAGIGSQAKALRNLGANFEHYGICEFDKYAVQSYNEIHGTSFATSDITKIFGSDLKIVDTGTYEYIMTYSFPCTDLSLAGNQQGMAKGSGTRSGLLWEVERLLGEITELPQILLMENVPQVLNKDFGGWLEYLESKGYTNHYAKLNAKDYGIPQNRERVFMVSILGKYLYEFPVKIPLKLRLKDMLESNVDEKYYLSDKALKGTLNTNFGCSKLENRTEKNGIIPTLCARDYKDPKCVPINSSEPNERFFRQTIETANENECNSINLKKSNIKNINSENELFTTLGTNCGSSTSSGGGVVAMQNYRIRKLTPKECWRLMGFSDTDFDKTTCSNAQLYKQAGNSIVVNVLMAIFRELL